MYTTMSSHGLPNLPKFAYISGSYALKCASGNNRINNNDIDIYIHITREDFDLEVAILFYRELLNSGFVIEGRRNNSIDRNGSNIHAFSHMHTFAHNINYLISSQIINNILNIDNEDDIQYAMDNTFFVTKMHKINDGIISRIDLIFILEDIEIYIENHFDLSICKNYIKSDNSIVQIFKQHVENNISEYKFSLLLKRLEKFHHIHKFIIRIYKYTNREINIYLTKEDNSGECYDCTNKNITCDIHGVLLSKDNMDNMLTNIANCLLQYHKPAIALRESEYKKKSVLVDNGNIIINDLHLSFTRLIKSSPERYKLLGKLIIAGANKLFLMQELKKVLLSPKYFDTSILYED